MKLNVNFYNHLTHRLGNVMEIEVTDKKIVNLCHESLKVTTPDTAQEKIKNNFCAALEEDLRKKGIINEYETVEYYQIVEAPLSQR